LFGEYPNALFSLETYHIMGSRILSRSFQVEGPPAPSNSDSGQTPAQEISDMSLDEASPHSLNNNDLNDVIDGDDSEDGDEPANVAMVPLADMLNARHGCGNVRVHYSTLESLRDLVMIDR
jgi:N-lysine methyltransferase SETD6